jgi:catechol 2,3-dioxygenase-like lactoylglutathione lyase family enzyme
LALTSAAANQGSSIRHLAIVTDNRERFVKFYTTVFGMKVVDGVGAAIHLGWLPQHGHHSETWQLQRRPLSLRHGSRKYRRATVCEDLGAATEIQKRPSNREAKYRVADPDGNLIDLS